MMQSVEVGSFTDYCDHKFIVSNGTYVCMRCGLVKEDKVIDQSHSYEGYKAQNEAQGIVYVKKNKDYMRNSFLLKRYQKTDRRTTIYEEKKLGENIKKINMIASKLELPQNIINEIETLNNKQAKEKIFWHRNMNYVLGALILYATRMHKHYISLNTLCHAIFNDEVKHEKKVMNCYTELIKKLDLSIKNQFIDIKYRIPGILADLNLSKYNLEGQIIELFNLYNQKYRYQSFKPQGILAGICYYLIQTNYLQFTQEDVAEIFEVSIQTLRIRQKQLHQLIQRWDHHNISDNHMILQAY